MERTKKVSVWMAVIAAIVLAVSVLVAAAPAPTSGDEENASSDPTASPTPSETTTGEECSTWQQVESDNGNNRWMAQGVASIREASSDEEAREASLDWAEQVRQDPQLLSGAAQYFLDEDVSPETLFEDKCATERAEQIYNELLLVLGESSVTPEDAPSDGVNSGVGDDGNVTRASSAGITGDRAAVKIVTKDGKTIWVMARCGNPVMKRPPKDVPPGPTDQPEKPEKPSPTPTLEKKDPSKDVLVNPDVPERVRGPGAGTNEDGPDDPAAHDPDNPDVQDDGYCQSCENDTSPPPEATAESTESEPPPEGTSGSAETDPDDDGPPPPEGGDEGVSDPEPEPSPPPEDEEPVEGSFCEENPDHYTC